MHATWDEDGRRVILSAIHVEDRLALRIVLVVLALALLPAFVRPLVELAVDACEELLK